MGFTSFYFPLFLVIVLIGYFLLPEKITWLWLLIASWFFYGYSNWGVFALLPAFSVVTYFSALGIERAKRQSTKKFLFIVTLIVIFGTLFLFKYLGFFARTATSIATLLGATPDEFTLNIVLPIGISFYTFQTASYVIDVYLGTAEAEKHFGYYALFVSYFPQLVAGPIERTDSLLPQLKEKHPFDWQNFRQGVLLLTSGYVKKVAVADVIAKAVNAVYNSPDLSQISALSAIVATALFLIQIYCDFSGYSDIAMGIAKIMGVNLMQNFKRPFSSETITEFWSRWHISLSGWFGEYLYRPLSFATRNKKNKQLFLSLNTLIVMLLSGLWHGADWSFVVWGLLLAAYQIIENLVKKPRADYCKKHGINQKATWRKWLRRVRTLILLAVSLVLFRSSNVSQAFEVYARMLTGWDPTVFTTFGLQTTLTWHYAVAIIFGIFAVWFLDRFITFDCAKTFSQKSSALIVTVSFIGLWIVLFAWSYLAATGQNNAFIYFQF